VPVTITLSPSIRAVALSWYAVRPSGCTCVTTNVIPSGPSVPSMKASVVASLHRVQ
jgi:hypothetical protein